MKYSLAFTILILFFSFESKTQSTDTIGVVTVETQYKEIFVGKLINITEDSIFIKNEEQLLSFNKLDIKSIHNGLVTKFSDTPNSSVPFYVQTALPNGRGNHYYKNYYLFGNEFNFGLSDNFNLTAGFESATVIFGGNGLLPLIQLGAKYSIKTSEMAHIGLSAKYYFNNEGSALLLDLPFTFGSERTNFTFSPNYISSEGDNELGIMANLSLSLGSRTRFIIDFSRINEENVFGPNFEFLFKNGFTLTLGGIFTRDGQIPSFSFSIPFGRWKKKFKDKSLNFK